MRRQLGLCSTLGSVIFFLSCGSSDGPLQPGDDPLDNGRAVTEVIDGDGGSLQVTDADGAIYTVTVPAGALAAQTRVTVTPFRDAATDYDMSALGKGVRLSPEGLEFAIPATIAVELTQAPTGPLPVLLHRSGSATAVLVPELSGTTLSTEIRHFSDVVPADATASLALAAWVDMMLEFEDSGPSSDLLRALADTFLSVRSANLPGSELTQYLDQMAADLRTVLTAFVIVASDECAAGDCVAGSAHLDQIENTALFLALDLPAVFTSVNDVRPYCDTGPLQLDVTLPPSMASSPVPLEIVALSERYGLRLQGASLEISVGGGTAAASSGSTDADGSFNTTITWDGVSATVEVSVTATHPNCGGTGNASVSATTTPGSGLVRPVLLELRTRARAQACCNPPPDPQFVLDDKELHEFVDEFAGLSSLPINRSLSAQAVVTSAEQGTGNANASSQHDSIILFDSEGSLTSIDVSANATSSAQVGDPGLANAEGQSLYVLSFDVVELTVAATLGADVGNEGTVVLNLFNVTETTEVSLYGGFWAQGEARTPIINESFTLQPGRYRVEFSHSARSSQSTVETASSTISMDLQFGTAP